MITTDRDVLERLMPVIPWEAYEFEEDTNRTIHGRIRLKDGDRLDLRGIGSFAMTGEYAFAPNSIPTPSWAKDRGSSAFPQSAFLGRPVTYFKKSTAFRSRGSVVLDLFTADIEPGLMSGIDLCRRWFLTLEPRPEHFDFDVRRMALGECARRRAEEREVSCG